ncbi:MAG: hypothetical protein RSE32_00255 [Comamonas sp.]|uniref:hypothetical protein n=1 Tax=Comamonas sp. TaxID=34028 RepID=UPI002FC5FBC0
MKSLAASKAARWAAGQRPWLKLFQCLGVRDRDMEDGRKAAEIEHFAAMRLGD